MSVRLVFALTVCVLLVSGCAKNYSPTACEALDPEFYTEASDPFESINRSIFNFNLTLDKALFEPTARTYKKITNDDLEKGISNFYNNLREPRNMTAAALMGNLPGAVASGTRFVVNSTFGLAGFIDIVGAAGLPYSNYDFGHVFGRWGVSEGPYLVAPIFGPTNVRDATDFAIHTRYTYVEKHIEKSEHQLIVQQISLVDTRAKLLPFTDLLEEQLDPYLFVRESYRQTRLNTICNQ